MSLGNFKAVHQDVKFNISVDEEVSPDPPEVYIREQGAGSWGTMLTPVLESSDTDAIPYNEFNYTWETTGKALGTYEIKTQDTDLAGNFGFVEGTFVLRASYNYWYGYEYGWGM